jgi:hypothetical protein
MVQWSSPVVKTNAGEPLISKMPFAVTKCSPWLASKQSPRLLGSKLSYTEICYSILPHLLPSSPYRQHTQNTTVTKPCSQYYGKTKQTCRHVWIWSFVWGVQRVASEPQTAPGYYIFHVRETSLSIYHTFLGVFYIDLP